MRALIIFLLLPFMLNAHPGIGIVKDSKGNIYYTDLQQVWKITPGGHKSIVVANVHTHELYMDAQDNLYGLHIYYSGEATDRWTKYVWQLNANGELDTVKEATDGFYMEDYSFARDNAGNMYWVRHGKKDRIMKTNSQGQSQELVAGNFKNVQWMLPVKDRLYFIHGDDIYYINAGNVVKPLVQNLSHKNEDHNTLFGLWADKEQNVYVANTALRKVQQINTSTGTVTDYYTSIGDWMPTGGVFDNQGRLWIMEYNSKNEVNVHRIDVDSATIEKQAFLSNFMNNYLPFIITIMTAGILIWVFKEVRSAHQWLA